MGPWTNQGHRSAEHVVTSPGERVRNGTESGLQGKEERGHECGGGSVRITGLTLVTVLT